MIPCHDARSTGLADADLWMEYQRSKSVRIRNKLVAKNIGLCRTVAHRMRNQTSETFDDLVAIGSQGLISAVEKFDPDSGYRFSSYAIPYIRGSILHWKRDRGYNHLRRSRGDYEAYNKMIALQKRMKEKGRSVSLILIAQQFGIDKKRLQEILDCVSEHPLIEIDSLRDVGDEGDPIAALEQLEERDRVRDAIAYWLPSDERLALEASIYRYLKPATAALSLEIGFIAYNNRLQSAQALVKKGILAQCSN